MDEARGDPSGCVQGWKHPAAVPAGVGSLVGKLGVVGSGFVAVVPRDASGAAGGGPRFKVGHSPKFPTTDHHRPGADLPRSLSSNEVAGAHSNEAGCLADAH